MASKRVSGFDLGTGNLKLAVGLPDGKVSTFILRNVFYEVPGDQSSREMLKRLKAPVFEIGGKAYLAGNEAFELAKIFGKEVRRPMQCGIISASAENRVAMPMIGAMIDRIMREAGDPGPDGVCSFSCPAPPVDTEIDSVLHQAIIEGKLRQLGWIPKMIHEGYGVVLSELGAEDFTGLALSFGAGMVNVCCAYKGIEIISFSSCRSGDFVDQKSSERLRIPIPRVTSFKESPGFDLRKDGELEDITISAYYRDVIRYALDHTKRRLEVGNDAPRFTDPVVVVVAGGTARVTGFIDVFKDVFKEIGFPIKAKEIRMAKDPTFAVALGALISAGM